MRNFLSDRCVSLKPSGIRKFFDIVSEMPDAISLGVGEPDFDTPWHIREEGIYSLERGKTFYTSNSGLMELRKEICNYLKRRIGVEYQPAGDVIITVGGSEAIDIAMRAMINPGDEVLIPLPSYVSYEPCCILAGGVPVTIGGTSYVPPLPIEQLVKERLEDILQSTAEPVNVAIQLCLYCMKTQIFNDGNKRAAVIFANHYMITKGQGLIVIPESHVPEFKRLLVAYYEDRDHGEIIEFMRSKCWRTF